jgi:hypothetical protein
MYEDFDKFLEYLEPKVVADGSVGLANAITEFWKIPAFKATKEQVTGRLHATGKYLVVRGEETTTFLIRHNPNYEVNENIKRTNTSIQNMNDKILPASFDSQRRFGNRSLILAGLSVLFIGATAYLQYRDKTAQRVQELQQIMRQQEQKIKEIRTSLQEINSSIGKLKNDSLSVYLLKK